MFAGMLLSNVKYQDPTEVLEAVVDDNGDSISIYEQKDIGEFFLNLLDRLQDGLGENKNLIRKVVAADFERQSQKFGQNSVMQNNDNNKIFMKHRKDDLLSNDLNLQTQNSGQLGADE